MFKRGDEVKCISKGVTLAYGCSYVVKEVNGDYIYVCDYQHLGLFHKSHFELVKRPSVNKTTGLTIQEAIKSGKQFKRSCYNLWCAVVGLEIMFLDKDNYANTPMRTATNDLLATDWEIKVDEKKELKFFEIMNAIDSCGYTYHRRRPEIKEKLKKLLGFKE